MKKLMYALFVVSTLLSCSTNNGNSEKNTALIADYIQAVENLDYDIMESMLDDSYIGLGPSFNDSIGKTKAIENWKYNVKHLYDHINYNKSNNIAVTIESGKNKGDWVSNWSELTIVYKKDKAEVTIWANTLYQLQNDKIIKSFTFYNEADVMEQLGYVFINLNDL